MRLRVVAVGSLALVLATVAAPSAGAALVAGDAAASPAGDAAAISRGLRQAVAAGRLSRTEAREFRAAVREARAVIGRVPADRASVLARVLHLVRLQAAVYNRPRALALFSMLAENARVLARRPVPPAGRDHVGRGGVVYRSGWGYGLQFHPLGNVAKLNALLTQRRLPRAATLASSLASRAVRTANGGAVWEYYFPYGSGRPPWTSGMAQAAGAQALARAARLLAAPDLFTVATGAYRPVPRALARATSYGPWVRLYSFSDLLVLNAQLQSALSVLDYGRIANNAGAVRFGNRLEEAARALLPLFDTGAWTNYVPGREAPLKYHLYHVQLARTLSRRTTGDVWAAAHARFDRYSREAPTFRSGAAGPPIYPWPRDGFRDERKLDVWVSKLSTVTVTVGRSRFALGLRGRGWHSVVWSPGRTRPKNYRPVVSAVDLAGNRGSRRLARVTVALDTDPPSVTARVAGRRLTWRAKDPTTPWLRMWALVQRGEKRRRLELGRRGFSGTLRLPVPRGTWETVLVVADSSGNRTRIPLGPVPARR